MKFTKRLTAMVLFVTTTVAISAQNVYVYKSGHFALKQQVNSASRITSTVSGSAKGIVVKNSSEEDQAFVSNTDYDYILFREANPKKQTVSVGEAKWATFAPSFNVDPAFTETTADANTRIYYVTGRDEETCLLELVNVNKELGEDKALQKGAGILVYSEKPTTLTFISSTAEEKELSGNLLVGTLVKTSLPKDDALYYYLAKKNDKVAFYVWATGQMAANRSYLRLPGGSSAPTFFSFGEETAVETVSESMGQQTDEIYSLSGQRLQHMQRGVNIVNGKKVLF